MIPPPPLVTSIPAARPPNTLFLVSCGLLPELIKTPTDMSEHSEAVDLQKLGITVNSSPILWLNILNKGVGSAISTNW